MEQITLDNCEIISDAECLKKAIKGQFEQGSSYEQYIDVVENKGYIAVKAKNLLVAKVAARKSYVHIEYPSKYDTYFSKYEIEPKKNDLSRVTLSDFSKVVALAHELAVIAADILATQGGESFACCGRYVECSDAKKCTHPDSMIAMACAYRKNLEGGRIFYGRNKNI